MMRRAKIVTLLLVALAALAQGRTITVGPGGVYDFNSIQAAIDDSNDGDTIIVADGIYTGPGNRDIEFSHGLPEGQTRAITVRSANGPQNCIIDCNGTESDRHRGFRFASGEDANSVINGFTIINGYAQWEAVSPPPLPVSREVGGAIYCGWYSSPTIINCIISGNTSGDVGGGIAGFLSNPTMTNCTFTGNSATDRGGGFWGSGIVKNCVFWGNSDRWGTNESAQIYNTTVVVVNYSCIQGLTGALGGIGNIGDDPCFVDPCNGDYHLKSQAGRWDTNEGRWTNDDRTSPCIDAGDPYSPIGNEPFPNGGRVNMGAYGGTAEASKSYFGEPVCETIVAGDINGDCKVNFLDFRLVASHWLEER